VITPSATTPRVAIIGCGAIARRAHVPALLAAGATVPVFASRSLASARAAADDVGAGDVTDDWTAVLVRDDVDAVVISTPNALHAEIAIAAAGAGKHVLVEKPMATTVADADRMIAAATAAGVHLMPAHNVRLAAPFVAAADAVRRGDIGEITSVRAAFGHGGPQQWAPDAVWFRDPALAGGGALIDLGVHVADLLRAVTGDDVVDVVATVHAPAGSVDDDAHVVVRFAGGARGTFHASWLSRSGPDHVLTVIGTEGTLHLDSRTPLTLLREGAKPAPVALPEHAANPCALFVRAMTGEAAPAISAHDGRAALAIVCAAYDSARSGAFVAVAVAVDSETVGG
jgi:predicted dehydrogenase